MKFGSRVSSSWQFFDPVSSCRSLTGRILTGRVRVIVILFLLLFSLPLSAQIQRLEYFIDTDPGVGCATQVTGFTKNANVEVPVAGISAASLTDGIHRMFVRAQGKFHVDLTNTDEYRWSLTQVRTFYHIKMRTLPDITRIEYFIDTDPGLGKGTKVTASTTVDGKLEQGFNVTLDEGSSGLHTLYVRSQNTEGRWSLTQSRTFTQFYVENLPQLDALEWFTDNDPGFGKGNKISLAGTSAGKMVTIDITGLAPGMHTLYLRGHYAPHLNKANQMTAEWGITNSITFVKAQVNTQFNITALEYFIDNDPGVGHGTQVAVGTPGTSITAHFTITPDNLAEGVHTLYVRSRNENGNWGIVQNIYFYKAASQDISKVERLEYFIDTDPGFGKGKKIDITPSENIIKPFTVSLDGIGPGIHRLYIRACNSAGRWSITQSGFFMKVVPTAGSPVTALEWFIDNDLGMGRNNIIPISASEGSKLFNVDVSSLAGGLHTLYVRTRNADGKWGITQSTGIIITAVPDAASQTDALEWFIDNDPGVGNANRVPVAASETTKAFTADFGTLPEGLHTLYVRARNSAGRWGVTQNITVNRMPVYDTLKVVRLEYYIAGEGDPAPAFGQATPVTIVPGQYAAKIFHVDLPGNMEAGWYTFNVRALDIMGAWSVTQQQGFYYTGEKNEAFADAVALEWFIDSDPGFGKGERVTLSSGTGRKMITVASDKYTEGLHTFSVRALNSRGAWGITQYATFYSVHVPKTGDITALEYFIDTDPGFGKAVPVGIASGQSLDRTVNIPLSNLPDGMHTLYLRARSSFGHWSQTHSISFQTVSLPSAVASELRQLEWFIDKDPGFGNGKKLALSGTSMQPKFTVTFDEDLAPGFHELYIRSQNKSGRWSITHSIPVLTAETPAGYTIPDVTAVEWFIDIDPGIRAANRVPLGQPGQLAQQTFTVPVASLTPGMHTFYVRAVNEKGAWSITHRQTFIKTDIPAGYELPEMARLEWFIDTDPGFGRGNSVDLLSQASTATAFNVTLEGVEDGPHTLYVRAVDKNGRWTHTQDIPFYRTDEKIGWKKETVYLEYFIDTDPGFGKGISIPVSPGDDVDKSVFIPLDNLQQGMHDFYFRARDVRGFWSLTQNIRLMVVYNDNPNLSGYSDIVALEYFIDTDPGFGKATQAGINRNVSVSERFFVEIDTVPAGLHDLYFRARNSRGQWGHTHSIGIYSTGIPQFPEMKDIVAFEYFVDKDPGAGKAVRVAALSPSQAVQQQVSVNVDTLKTGIHAIFVRAQDNRGAWSHTQRFNFIKAAVPNNFPVTALEWFIDTDPGVGKGKAVSVSPGASVDRSFNVSLPDDLPTGTHSLYIRARNQHNEWGITHSIDFATIRVRPPSGIAALEYFIDDDPGFGAATPIPVPYGSLDAQVPAVIPLAGIEPGMHTFFVRAKNIEEAWSVTQYQSFVVTKIRHAAKVMEMEYFVDTDPGFGKGLKVPGFIPGTDIDKKFTVDLLSQQPGLHTLYVRVRDEEGHWSITQDITFIRVDNPVSSDIAALEWFIDTDPGFGKGRVQPVSSASASVNIPIDIDNLDPGIHTLYTRARNSSGQWGITHDITFLKLEKQKIANILSIEWFIDDDPGFGKSPHRIDYGTPQAHASWTTQVNTSALAPGIHTLYVRAQNEEGRWSITQSNVFVKVEKPVTSGVVALEWFVDTDPGFGKANPATVGVNIPVNTSALSAGLHTFYVRSINAAGKWSITQDITFVKVEEHVRPGIAGFEWFIDTDPGFGKANQVSLSGNTSLHEFVFDVSSITNGFHTLYMRARDENGQWSITQDITIKRYEDTSDVSDIVAVEWFIDDDPGFGNAPASQRKTYSEPQRQVIETFRVNVSHLDMGLHTFSVRAQNDSGRWSLTQYETFAIVRSRNIEALEWFIDTDKGFGKNTVVQVTPGASANILLNIPTETLGEGAHSLYIRAKNEAGSWSITQNFEFVKVSLEEIIKPDISRIEYFFDTDPGFGKAIPVNTGPGTNITKTFTAQMPANTPPGIHTFYVRALDTLGRWSQTQYSQFIKVQKPEIPNTVALEWFIDTDPGFGKATRMPVTEGTSTGGSITLSSSDIATGMHILYVRALDATGKWSHTHSIDFMTVDVNQERTAKVTAIEYFFDDDPGFGQGTWAPNVTASPDVTKTFHVTLPAGMAQGVHTFCVRSLNEDGHWSITQYSQFIKVEKYVAPNTVALEWFIDVDPGFGKATWLALPSGSNTGGNIMIAHTAPGPHTLYVRALDVSGKWSLTQFVDFITIDMSQLRMAETVALEYFIDTDPGFGKAKRININPASTAFTLPFMLTADLLAEGAHTLYIRALDKEGHWSITHDISLLVLDVKASEIAKVTALEYFFDTDPGFRKGKIVNVSPAAEMVSRKFFVQTSGLSDGVHTLFVRAINEDDTWSITQYNMFVKMTPIKRLPDIIRIEYFIDDDPGFGKGKPIATSPDITTSKIFKVDLTGVTLGEHHLYIRALNSDGKWAITHDFKINIANIPPVDEGEQPQGGAAVLVNPDHKRVCLGRVPEISIRAEGYSKRVGTWEYRTIYEDGTASKWNTVTGSTSVTLLKVIPTKAGKWQYRAMIYNGDRGPEPSLHAEVEVVDAAVGGTVTANLPEYVCPNTLFKLMLESYKGTIVRWQARNTSDETPEWKDIAGTDAENTVTPDKGGVWEYRAEVAMGDCSNAFSKALKVNVISSTTGGVVEPATLNACTGKSFELNAKNFLGKVTHWQRSTDKGATWTDIAHASATYVPTETVVGEVRYRAVVKAGNCIETYSDPSVITVLDKVGAASPIVGPVTVCQPSEDLTYSIDVIGGIDSYEWTLQNGAAFASESNSNAIKVNFDAVSVAATRITVKGISDMCGAGDASVIDIAVYKRPVVSKISGSATICVGQQETYSVTPIAGVKYEWILPEGWTNLTPGTESPSITITPGAFGVGIIKLRVTNEFTGCYTEVETDLITITTGVRTGPIYRLPNN